MSTWDRLHIHITSQPYELLVPPHQHGHGFLTFDSCPTPNDFLCSQHDRDFNLEEQTYRLTPLTGLALY